MILAYFYSLLIPLRDTSLVFRGLFTAIAREFDALYAYGLEELKGAFPRFSKGSASLSLWGNERAVEPIHGEALIAYAKRVERAFRFLSRSTTASGLRDIILTFTVKPFSLRELFLESWILGKPSERLGLNTILGGEHEANAFILQFDRLTLAEREYIDALMELYKPAHVACRIHALVQDDWILGAPGEQLGKNTYI